MKKWMKFQTMNGISNVSTASSETRTSVIVYSSLLHYLHFGILQLFCKRADFQRSAKTLENDCKAKDTSGVNVKK